jgi:Holliday junction resolvasome RuvABC ATP-dependent DNA helicase subunit
LNTTDAVFSKYIVLQIYGARDIERCNCSCFEIDLEMDAILLIIDIAYGVCRIVIKLVQQCRYFLFL